MKKKVKFGIIISSSNTVLEPELNLISPQDIGIYVSRVLQRKPTIEEIKLTLEYARRAGEELSTAQVNLILYAITIGSIVIGREWENKFINKLTGKTGVNSITTASSVIKALKRLEVKKIIVLTPYTEEMNQLEKIYLEKSGIEVLDIKGLNGKSVIEIGGIDEKIVYENSLELFNRCSNKAQAIFISCTNLNTFEIISKLESKIKIPVITSNQASFWNLIRTYGDQRKIYGYGTLLENY